MAAEKWLRDEWKGNFSIGRVPGVSSTVSFEAGRLVAEARQRQQKSRRCWPHAWAKLRDPKRRRWLPKH
jgi:hypothetical protein